MTSQNRQKGTYVYAEDSTDAPTDYEVARQRHATVYDAVAGRVSHKFSKDAATSGSRKTLPGQHHHLGDPVLTPEEVLFSRKRAPQRYAERDIYFAHEGLPDAGRDVLPDSDMLKSVHGYASRFYDALGQQQQQRHHEGRARGDARHVDERSMDETALLAFGILLEEAAREALGRDGDLVFTEGVVEDDEEGTGDAGRPHAPVGFEGDREFWRRSYAKRRKVAGKED